EVAGEREEDRRLERRRDSLTGARVRREHDAVDRRVDLGAREIRLRDVEGRARLLDGGLGAADRAERTRRNASPRREFRLRRQLRVADLAQVLQAVLLSARLVLRRAGLVEARLGRRQRSARLELLRLEARGIEARQHLAGLDVVVEADRD